MLSRRLESRVNQLARQFPVVLILGPHQCGKTTFARQFLQGEYFDLERPTDRQLFEAAPELALRRVSGTVIVDEAQVVPGLFPVLRALVDRSGRVPGKYILLSSVNPLLMRQISETLAGRVGVAELTQFIYPEIASLNSDKVAHWIRGRFPDAYQAQAPQDWLLWMENCTRTFIERDVAQVSPGMSTSGMRRLFGLLAHNHGGLLNASEVGRALGVS